MGRGKRNTAKNIWSIYDQGVITDCQVWNWFSKFCSGDTSLRDKPRRSQKQEVLRESNPNAKALKN